MPPYTPVQVHPLAPAAGTSAECITRRLLKLIIGSGISPPFSMDQSFGVFNVVITTHPFAPRLHGEVAFSPDYLVATTTFWAHSEPRQADTSD